MNKAEHKILDVLKSLHRVFDFSLYKGGKKEEFSIFVISVPSVEILDYEWEKIVSKIAVEYQTQLGKGPERWNIYLAFIAHFKIPRGLKYKIENDKYSSRKIVFDEIPKTEEESEITRRISKRIFELDINTQRSLDSSLKDLPGILDPKLHKVISGVNLDGQAKPIKDEKKRIFKELLKDEKKRIFKELLKGYSNEI
jgi:hypothetical protein